jgi:exopolysaccharide biosynthesis polyprenyl glycosylphosphotransferase
VNIKIKNKVIPSIEFTKLGAAFQPDIINKYRGFSASFSEQKTLLILGDALLLGLSVICALFLWRQTANVDFDVATQIKDHRYWLSILLSGWLVLAWLNNLYHIPSSFDKKTSAIRVASVCAIGSVIYLAVVFLYPTELTSTLFFYFLVILWVVITLWRWTYAKLFSILPMQHRVVIAGNGKRGESVAKLFGMDLKLNYKVLGYVEKDLIKPRNGNGGLPILGQVKDLPRLVKKLRVHEVAVAIEQNLESEIFEMLVECQASGVRISSITDLYEKFLDKIPVEYINPDWAMHIIENGAVFDRLHLGLKRLFDILLSTLGLIGIFLPLLPLVALAIRLDSAGPIFYTQIRSGRAGKPFSIIKFRTMITNAEEDGKARWASRNDKRITRMGRFMRQTRIDELPQLLNVLRGNMSIIGPRPERPEFIEKLQQEIPFYSTRLLVKPGLTGWAQVRHNYGNTIEDALIKLQYDLYYLRYWSLWMDLYIIFHTIGVVFKFRGT